MVLSISDFFRKMHRGEEGFTLIELLIVIAILAVLAAIAIPLVVNRIDKARESADLANVSQLQSAVDLYLLDFDSGGENKPATDLRGLAGISDGIVDNGKTEDLWMGKLVSAGYLQKLVESPYGDAYKLKTGGTTGNLVVTTTHTP